MNRGQLEDRAQAQIPPAASLERLVHLVGNARVLREALLGKACLFPQRAQPFGEKQGFLRTFGQPISFLDSPPDNTNLFVSDSSIVRRIAGTL